MRVVSARTEECSTVRLKAQSATSYSPLAYRKRSLVLVSDKKVLAQRQDSLPALLSYSSESISPLLTTHCNASMKHPEWCGLSKDDVLLFPRKASMRFALGDGKKIVALHSRLSGLYMKSRHAIIDTRVSGPALRGNHICHRFRSYHSLFSLLPRRFLSSS